VTGDARVYLDLADLLEEIGKSEDAERYRAAARKADVKHDDDRISEWRRRHRRS
jgi:thiamine kinase-like enzyme